MHHNEVPSIQLPLTLYHPSKHTQNKTKFSCIFNFKLTQAQNELQTYQNQNQNLRLIE